MARQKVIFIFTLNCLIFTSFGVRGLDKKLSMKRNFTKTDWVTVTLY